MARIGTRVCGIAVMAASFGTGAMGQVSLTLIPAFTPRWVSGDGAVVVGYDAQNQVALWTAAGGVQPLGFSGNIEGIDQAGTVVVGTSFDSGPQAWRWTQATGRQVLTAAGEPYQARFAQGVSADGVVVVGEGSGNSVFRWTASGGAQELAPGYCLPTCVSGDGNAAAGAVVDADGFTLRPAIWRSGSDPQIIYSEGPAGNQTMITALSVDGSVAAGMWDLSGGPDVAFRWEAATGVVQVASINSLSAMTADGSVLLGLSYFTPGRVVLWDAERGARTLPDLLAAGGVDMTGLDFATVDAMSDDAAVIVGRLNEGSSRGYVARLGGSTPPSCPADFDNQNGVQVADIFAFLRAWFANAPSADFDGMNGIQVADIFAFLRAWFAGC